MTVAALFVQAGGVYFNLDDVDPWDEERDARRYAGPHPVVAHPPCQRWGALGAAAYARWGGEHNRPGNDGGCFFAALQAVLKWGGVLEHPAKSLAWDHYGLTKPAGAGWLHVGPEQWTCEVWQSAYGHRANKATWLYYVGEVPPAELRWDRPKGTHQVGFQDTRGKGRNKPTLSKREANATPLPFRDTLISLAQNAIQKQGEAMTDDQTKPTVKAGSATPDFVGGEKLLFSFPSLEELGIYRKADRNRAKRARRKARGKRWPTTTSSNG